MLDLCCIFVLIALSANEHARSSPKSIANKGHRGVLKMIAECDVITCDGKLSQVLPDAVTRFMSQIQLLSLNSKIL